MSTCVNTRKYEVLKERSDVAVLVHDFGDGTGESTGDGELHAKFSITLSGTCEIETGKAAERHRQIHLESNPSYAQFIVGNDIAILAIYVKSARICDINDNVSHWKVQK
eukprot:CAMPEP_0194292562 /NCGR_PEP_ID=MMETSP0169-20130528/45918_1 /TAXON_ID=218684 /ORGANISM="Corethron pennatum, Strain L29A3" /LENGTH=108 /DNA_ID=CAMNT_0039040773 /DNA_START=363 /DNA_END=689 /DNA_ORIENTATION=+